MTGRRAAANVGRAAGRSSGTWRLKQVLATLIVLGAMSFLTVSGAFGLLASETNNLGSKASTGTLTFTDKVGTATACNSYKQFDTALTSGLTSGIAVTSLSVSALTGAVRSGDSVVVTTGTTTQTFVANAAANAGATTISVTSLNANANYPSGSTVAPLANINTNCDALFTNATLMYPGTPATVNVTITNNGSIDINDLGLYMPSCSRVATPGAPLPIASTFGTTLRAGLTSGAAVTTLGVNALSGSIAAGASVVVSSGTSTQTFVASAGASAGATSISVTSQNANFSYPIGSPVVNAGSTTGGTFSATLSSGLTNGVAVTTLSTSGLVGSIVPGDSIVVTSGANTQTFIASAYATAGDTSLEVVSQNANFSYPAASPVASASADPCAGSGAQLYIQETNSDFATNPQCSYPTTGGACGFAADTLSLFAANMNTVTSAWDLGSGPAAGSSRYFVIGMRLPPGAATTLQGQEAVFALTWHATT